MLRKRLQPCLIFILAASLPAQTFSTAADPAIPHNYVNTNLLRSPPAVAFQNGILSSNADPATTRRRGNGRAAAIEQARLGAQASSAVYRPGPHWRWRRAGGRRRPRSRHRVSPGRPLRSVRVRDCFHLGPERPPSRRLGLVMRRRSSRHRRHLQASLEASRGRKCCHSPECSRTYRRTNDRSVLTKVVGSHGGSPLSICPGVSRASSSAVKGGYSTMRWPPLTPGP